MSKRDYEAEKAAQQNRQDHATSKIDAHRQRMTDGSPTDRQKADDQQLLNEMRGNKASLDLNRAMQEYDEEHRNADRDSTMPFLVTSSSPTRSFTAGARDAKDALQKLDEAVAAGHPDPVCTDRGGRAYSREDLGRMDPSPSPASAARP